MFNLRVLHPDKDRFSEPFTIIIDPLPENIEVDLDFKIVTAHLVSQFRDLYLASSHISRPSRYLACKLISDILYL